MATKDRYLFDYTNTRVHLGPIPSEVSKSKRTFKTIADVRAYAYGSPNRLGISTSSSEGYIYDLKTGKIVGAIRGDVYYYKQNGRIYWRFMNKGGALDSYYGKHLYDGDKIKF